MLDVGGGGNEVDERRKGTDPADPLQQSLGLEAVGKRDQIDVLRSL